MRYPRLRINRSSNSHYEQNLRQRSVGINTNSTNNSQHQQHSPAPSQHQQHQQQKKHIRQRYIGGMSFFLQCRFRGGWGGWVTDQRRYEQYLHQRGVGINTSSTDNTQHQQQTPSPSQHQQHQQQKKAHSSEVHRRYVIVFSLCRFPGIWEGGDRSTASYSDCHPSSAGTCSLRSAVFPPFLRSFVGKKKSAVSPPFCRRWGTPKQPFCAWR